MPLQPKWVTTTHVVAFFLHELVLELFVVGFVARESARARGVARNYYRAFIESDARCLEAA